MPALIGFTPDIDETTEGAIVLCNQVIPTLRGMGGAPTPIDMGLAALADPCLGAASLNLLDNTRRVIAGTADALYALSGTSWADISRSTAYATTGSNKWRFAQYGNAVLATNKDDLIQVSTGSDFADIADAPKASYIVSASGYIVAFGINDSRVGGDRPDAWWCSGLYDYATWTPADGTLAQYGYLLDTPGDIRGAKKLGDNIVVYKEKSIYIGQSVGSPTSWSWYAVRGEIGAISNDSIVSTGTVHLFIGSNDLYIFDGSQPVPIGSPVREWLFENADAAYLNTITGTYDAQSGNVWWYYSASGSGGAMSDALVYNITSKRWGHAVTSSSAVFDFITPDVTWDQWPPGDATTFDNSPAISFDSDAFDPGRSSLALFGADNKVYTLTGSCGDSSITVGSFGDDSQYSTLTGVIPRFLQRPTTSNFTHYTREYLGGQQTNRGKSDLTGNRYDALFSGRYHKGRFEFTGDFEIVGFTPVLVQDGTQ